MQAMKAGFQALREQSETWDRRVLSTNYRFSGCWGAGIDDGREQAEIDVHGD